MDTYSSENCAVVILAEGFDEVEAVGILTALRAAGICVKSLGLTSGLIAGRYGVPLMPDYALVDLSHKIDVSTIDAVIVPGKNRGLARLETDPRVHRLLRRVTVQRGLIATSDQGYRLLKRSLRENEVGREGDNPALLLRASTQTVDAFAQSIIRRLKRA